MSETQSQRLNVWNSMSETKCQSLIYKPGHMSFLRLPSSVSKSSSPLEQFRVRVGTGTEPLQQVLPHKNPDRSNWASFTTQPRQFKCTILAPIKYLSSDHIMTWSVSRLCNFGRSFASHCQICDWINIGWVAIANPLISHTMLRYSTAIHRILVGSQLWMREVVERLTLHNLHTDHVRIRSELKYSIVGKVAGTLIWNHGLGSTLPKNCGFMSRLGHNLALLTQVGVFSNSWSGPGPLGRFQPGQKPGNLEPLLTLRPNECTISYCCTKGWWICHVEFSIAGLLHVLQWMQTGYSQHLCPGLSSSAERQSVVWSSSMLPGCFCYCTYTVMQMYST